MKKNEGRVFAKTGQRIAGGKGKAQLARNRCAESFGELQVALDGMSATIDVRDLVVKKARAFARVAHAKNFARATAAGDECAAQ